MHDLLFSSNGIKNLSDGPYKTAIMRNEIRLRAELVKLKIKLKVKNNEDLISPDYRNSGTYYLKIFNGKSFSCGQITNIII